MCYSAMVWASYGRFVSAFKADISIRDFVRIYLSRDAGKAVAIPRAMDEPFLRPRTAEEFEILSAINRHRARQAEAFAATRDAQQARLDQAVANLARKTTKKDQNDARIAANKISKANFDLADLQRKEPVTRDTRIFPKSYAPVMISIDGRRTVVPMRYLIRPAGFPPSFDTTHDGAYNARRDNLQKFWRNQFTHTHGIVVAQKFYEWVDRQDENGGVYKQELEFDPEGVDDMLAACIWSRWTGPDGETLDSFALITDTPPPEVAAAGHDRCIIPLRSENIDAWLNPTAGDYSGMQAVLEERERPYYQHRLAA